MDTATYQVNQEPSALPQEALAALLESIPPTKLLRLLKKSGAVCQQVFHGFKVQPSSLRVPIVRRRLRERLEKDEEFLVEVVALWDQENPEVRRAVQQRSVAALRQELTQLAERWGGGAVAIALAADARASVRELLESKAKVLEKFSRTPVKAEAPSVRLPDEEEPSAEMQSLREEIGRWQQKHAALRQQHAETVRSLEQVQTEHRKTVQQTTALQKQLLEWQATCAALQKQADRAARQKQKFERENQALRAENKRLKKQVRQLTLALEEARRAAQQAAVEPERESRAGGEKEKRSDVPASLPLPPARPPAPPQPTATTLRWNINGDRYSVSLAHLRQAVDTNQEEIVFKTAESLKRLRRADEAQFAAVVQRLKEIGRYYAHVLTQSTMRVIVDGSNVAHAEKNRRGQAQLRNILAMRDELRALDFFPILIYADASLPYQIDQREELMRLAHRGEIRFVPAGTSADDIIAREAKELGCYVVTNDRKLTHNLDPTWELQIVGFKIIDGQVMLEDF
jgi:myosin heavy subunit